MSADLTAQTRGLAPLTPRNASAPPPGDPDGQRQDWGESNGWQTPDTPRVHLDQPRWLSLPRDFWIATHFPSGIPKNEFPASHKPWSLAACPWRILFPNNAAPIPHDLQVREALSHALIQPTAPPLPHLWLRPHSGGWWECSLLITLTADWHGFCYFYISIILRNFFLFPKSRISNLWVKRPKLSYFSISFLQIIILYYVYVGQLGVYLPFPHGSPHKCKYQIFTLYLKVR